jgi:hypothetical protein
MDWFYSGWVFITHKYYLTTAKFTNKELMALYQELDVVAEIKKAGLRWLGHA